MKLRVLICTLCLTVLALPMVATAADEEDVLGGFGGTVLYENSVGLGTFTQGEYTKQPYWNMLLSIRPNYEISKDLGITAWMQINLNQNVVENYGSGNTRPHDVQLADIQLYTTFSNFLKVEEAFLSFSGYAKLYLPTSRVSRLTRKYLGLRLSSSMKFAPLDWMSLTYGFSATKNFNEYTNSVVDVDEFDFPLPSRAGGSEGVSEGLVATGKQITEWSLMHQVGLGFSFLEDFSVDVVWYYYQNFTYQSFELDELSSVNAVGGRGYSDLMVGVIEVGYSVTDYLSLSLGTLVEQTPKTSDNQNFRFPFWDTTNGADNRQTFYLDVVARF